MSSRPSQQIMGTNIKLGKGVSSSWLRHYSQHS